MNQKPLFCCYSVPLKDYLTAHGVRYEVCGLNPNSKMTFWVYMRTQQLTELLDRWRAKT